MKAIRYVLPVLFTWMVGCTSVSFEPTSAARAYPPFKGNVQVLQTFPSEGTYVLLGTIVVTGPNVSRDGVITDEVLDTAAEAGGNAVVLQTTTIVEATMSDNRRRLGAYAIRLK